MISGRKETLSAIAAFLFSFLASSHHWLHMGILMVMGGSGGMMATMSAVVWVRRLMIVMSIVTVAFSLYRLMKHRCRKPGRLALSVGSAIISVGIVLYTLFSFGW
ncbi:hypothetical protein AB6A23_01205 [Paenibacillus tarimensis]